MKVPDLKSSQMITIAYLIGIVVVLFIVYKILGAVGLIKTAAKKKEQKAEGEAETELRTSEYFDPMVLQGNTSYKPLGSQAKFYANELKKAMRGLGTNEERIFTTFGKLNNKLNISEVALNYQVEFGGSLIVDLLNELTDAEQVTLFNIIEKLPNK